MKKSELRQIIKEEITSVLKEEYDPNQDPEKKGSVAYKRAVWKGQFGTMDGFDKAYPQYSKGGNNKKGEIKDQIDRSLEQIQIYLYYMPDQQFATVMKRWFSEYSDAADKEAMDMLHDLEKSLKRFDEVLNYKNNKVKY